jgi:membrane fusion protein (multidrug efflux system)
VGRGESTLLATVSAVDPIYVNFQMNETNYLGLARWIAEHEEELKSQNERPVQVLLTLSDKQPYPLPGTVDFIDRNIDPSTGAIALRAVFPNPKKLIKPGNFATVQLIVNEKDDAIIIPQGAIQQIQNKYFAFRVNDSNKVHRIPVTTGQHIGNKVLITDGLKAGDRILLEGFQKFQEGMKITPVPMTDSTQVSQHP